MALATVAGPGFSFAGGLYGRTFIFLTPTPGPGRPGGTLGLDVKTAWRGPVVDAAHGRPSRGRPWAAKLAQLHDGAAGLCPAGVVLHRCIAAALTDPYRCNSLSLRDTRAPPGSTVGFPHLHTRGQRPRAATSRSSHRRRLPRPRPPAKPFYKKKRRSIVF